MSLFQLSIRQANMVYGLKTYKQASATGKCVRSGIFRACRNGKKTFPAFDPEQNPVSGNL